MLELQILGFNILLPVAVMLGGWLIVHLLQPKAAVSLASPENQAKLVGKSASQALAACTVAAAGCLAIVAAILFRVEAARVSFPEDAWARIPHALILVTASAMVSLFVPNVWGWLARGIAIFFAARMMIPRGEAWEFIEPLLPVWLSMMIGSSLGAWYLSARLSRSTDNATRWGSSTRWAKSSWAGVLSLGWIACVAAAAFLTKDFLRVTEPLLAVASVLGMAGLMSVVYRAPQLASIVAGPCVFAMSAAVASAQFNSYLGLPDSLSWLAMAAPSVAGLSTLAIRAQDQPVRKGRIALVVLACIAIAAMVITWTAVAGEAGGGEEEW